MKQRKPTATAQRSSPPIQLDRFTLLHLRLYQLLGLCSVPLQLKCDLATVNQRLQQSKYFSMSQLNRYLLIWHCLLFICFILLHLWTITNHDSIICISDGFGKFNDLLKLSATITAHFVILSETLLKRQCMHKFLSLYIKITCHIKWFRSVTYCTGYRLFRPFFWKSVIFITIIIIIDLNYIWETSRSDRWLSFFIPCIPSAIICQVHSVQIVHFIELLRLVLEQLNMNVERLAEFSRRGVMTSDPPRQKQRKIYDSDVKVCTDLHLFMECYQDIYEMCFLLKQSVGAPLVCNYRKEYMIILSECYWSYWMFHKGENIIEYSLNFSSAMTIFLLLITSRNCMIQTHFLAHNVHKTRHDIEDFNISSTRLQSFSLQLLHQHIIMDGFGFFVLNCNMARDVLGSIATYMIFFIQFMPKFKKA
ncbi:gustatory receptor 8a-like [Eurosta solidaginis]|uniref:gustatory receptor 8a-like n=1 Tax=Eurosta solidaginis TaxID=178769 RepID=UPI003530E3FB